jgi:hypothetical protein
MFHVKQSTTGRDVELIAQYYFGVSATGRPATMRHRLPGHRLAWPDCRPISVAAAAELFRLHRDARSDARPRSTHHPQRARAPVIPPVPRDVTRTIRHYDSRQGPTVPVSRETGSSPNAPASCQPKEGTWPTPSTGRSRLEETRSRGGCTEHAGHGGSDPCHGHTTGIRSRRKSHPNQAPSSARPHELSALDARSHREAARSGALAPRWGEKPNQDSPDLRVSVGHAGSQIRIDPTAHRGQSKAHIPAGPREPLDRTSSKSRFADGGALDDWLDSHPAAKPRAAPAPI